MKPIFIQSFMNDNAETFLEVGSTDPHDVDAGIFTSIPTAFNVMSSGTCFIEASKEDFSHVQFVWGVTLDEVKKALQKQWGETLVVFNVK